MPAWRSNSAWLRLTLFFHFPFDDGAFAKADFLAVPMMAAVNSPARGRATVEIPDSELLNRLYKLLTDFAQFKRQGRLIRKGMLFEQSRDIFDLPCLRAKFYSFG